MSRPKDLLASNQLGKRFMQPARLSLILILVLPWLLGLISGCQDGPIPENRMLNPWARKQWEEDESFGPTYYKRMDELATIRAKAPRLADSERERLAQEIIDVYGLDTSPAMRCELVRTLAYLPTGTAQTALAAALADEDSDVRIAACQGLARVQGEESLPLLARTAQTDEHLDVRIAAVRGLGHYREQDAMQALGTALEDSDPAVQKVAIESLRLNTGRDYGNSVPAWKEFLAGGTPSNPPGPSLAERIGWPWF